jgi:RND family efflux transporter MFP subunit
VSAPGEVQALVQQQVRAPFAGIITALDVVEGDRVHNGQTVGSLVARDAQAAVTGAKEMLRAARTPQEQDDAQRALELAKDHLVTSPLTTSVAGIVTARSAAPGDRVSEGQELITVVDESSLVFRARVAQSDLGGIRPGERAEVELSGAGKAIPGTVHGVLPGIDPAALTAPVRIDLDRRPRGFAPGLFGTATIVVGEDENVLVVPEAALLRDDVQGTVRVGVVRPDHTLHWVEVTEGLAANSRVEITPVSGTLSAGDLVATSGHVGLSEGAAVNVTKTTDPTKGTP